MLLDLLFIHVTCQLENKPISPPKALLCQLLYVMEWDTWYVLALDGQILYNYLQAVASQCCYILYSTTYFELSKQAPKFIINLLWHLSVQVYLFNHLLP